MGAVASLLAEGGRYLVLQESHSILRQQHLVGLLDRQRQILVEELNGALLVGPTAQLVNHPYSCHWGNFPVAAIGMVATGKLLSHTPPPPAPTSPKHTARILPTSKVGAAPSGQDSASCTVFLSPALEVRL